MPKVAPISSVNVCQAIWTQFNYKGELCLRIVIEGKAYPKVAINGISVDIPLRISPPLPQFPITVWEMSIPSHAKTLNVEGVSISPPNRSFKKIAIIGDTGCRPNQSWSDSKWPFKPIIQQIIAEKPDLIIHLGDYIYRHFAAQQVASELPLTPFEGDTWDGWQKEFFIPADGLLSFAPWVFVRGNQEACDRAVNGWRIFLDAYPYANTCSDYTDPFFIPLRKVDLIIHDSSVIDPAYEVDIPHQQLNNLKLSSDKDSWLLTHRPLWGIVEEKNKNGDLEVILNEHNYIEPFLQPFPKNLKAIFSGHIHAFQCIQLVRSKIKQFVIGNSGVRLEKNEPPQVLDHTKIDGKFIEHADSIREFGYGILEDKNTGWTLTAKNVQGKAVKNFTL